ncbi:MAG: hypothetical protein ABI345_01390 [Jatrophihabitans sp.]
MQPGNDQHPGAAQPGWQGNPGRQSGPGYAQPNYGSPYGSPQQDPASYGPPQRSPYGPPQGAPQGSPQLGPADGSPYAGPAVAMPRRGRPGLIVLVSFLVQLVIIAAGCNQGVSDWVQKFSFNHTGFARVAAQTPLVYSWRFAPDNRDNIHAYPAMMFGLLAVFVLAALLTLALVRGPITFGRAFFGVWLSVIVATLLAGMVGRAVVKDIGQYPQFGNKAGSILFAGTGNEVIAGITLGFFAALIAAIVAVVSRRPAVVPVVADATPSFDRDPEPPPPYYGEDTSSRGEPQNSQTMSMQKVQSSVGESRDAPRYEPEPRRETEPSYGDQRTQSLPATGAGATGQSFSPPPSAPPSDPGHEEASRPPAGPAAGQWPPTSGGDQLPQDATTRLPRFDPSAPPTEQPVGGAAPAAGDQQQPPPPRRDTTDEATSSFPRPPDDESMEDPDPR